MVWFFFAFVLEYGGQGCLWAVYTHPVNRVSCWLSLISVLFCFVLFYFLSFLFLFYLDVFHVKSTYTPPKSSSCSRALYYGHDFVYKFVMT